MSLRKKRSPERKAMSINDDTSYDGGIFISYNITLVSWQPALTSRLYLTVYNTSWYALINNRQQYFSLASFFFTLDPQGLLEKQREDSAARIDKLEQALSEVRQEYNEVWLFL